MNIERTHDATEDVSGKPVHHVARYSEPRLVGDDKQILDVVTTDGTVYRFEQLNRGEQYKFAPGDGRDNRIQRSGVLPNTVEAICDAEFDGVGYYYG